MTKELYPGARDELVREFALRHEQAVRDRRMAATFEQIDHDLLNDEARPVLSTNCEEKPCR